MFVGAGEGVPLLVPLRYLPHNDKVQSLELGI